MKKLNNVSKTVMKKIITKEVKAPFTLTLSPSLINALDKWCEDNAVNEVKRNGKLISRAVTPNRSAVIEELLKEAIPAEYYER